MTERQIQLFWQKVQVTDTCWLWTASVGWNGYGMFGKPTKRAHRVALELAGVVLKPAWHRWGKWRDVTLYKIRSRNDDISAGVLDGVPYFIEKGATLMQHRECLDCGKKQSREIPA